MRHYCTLFDRNYLPRGLALHRSLLRHGGKFLLHVLCLDEGTQKALTALDLAHVQCVSIGDLEQWDPQLAAARPGRSPAEFYFTCKPVLLGYILGRRADIGRLTYLDSDLYYLSDAAAGEREVEGSSVALSPHRFSAASAHRRRFGEFNAGWVSVDAGAEARRFVAWWRERCLEWCRLAVEETRFGDQKYLDQVPRLFPASRALSHPGVNAGPWNIEPRAVELRDGQVFVAGRPLVVYHFHGVRRMLLGWYDCGLHEYGVPLTPAIREGLYRPYLREVAGFQAAQQPAPGGLLRQAALTARALARRSAVYAAA